MFFPLKFERPDCRYGETLEWKGERRGPSNIVALRVPPSPGGSARPIWRGEVQLGPQYLPSCPIHGLVLEAYRCLATHRNWVDRTSSMHRTHPANRERPKPWRTLVVVALCPQCHASLATGTALAISRAEVDEACADSQEAYDIYRSARSDFEVAAVALEEANAELDAAEYQEQRIRNAYEARQEEKAELSTRVESQAVELYMQAASGPSMGMVSLSSPSEALTAYEFLRANADQSMQSVNDLAAISSELDRLGVTLEAAVAELTTARMCSNSTADQEAAMTSALGAYDDLSDRCKELQAAYEAEQARLRAEAEERARQRAAAAASRGGSGDSGSGSTGPIIGGIICPFSPGRRIAATPGVPGVRVAGAHKGTDMMAPFDEPIYAVANGTISTGSSGLGGKTIWLLTGGVAFYYAHLSGFAVGDGASVSQGDLIAYNGNTGNASGGAHTFISRSIRVDGARAR